MFILALLSSALPRVFAPAKAGQEGKKVQEENLILLSFFLDEKERKNQDCLKKYRKSTELPTTDKKNSPDCIGIKQLFIA